MGVIFNSRKQPASQKGAGCFFFLKTFSLPPDIKGRAIPPDSTTTTMTTIETTLASASTITAAESAEKATARYIAHMLGTNPAWAQRAITVLYAFQTADEQVSGSTKEHNGAGFNGTDAFILSSFAEQIAKGWKLSVKQLAIAYRKLPKYSRQIWGAVPAEKRDGITVQGVAWAAVNPPVPKVKKEKTEAEVEWMLHSR